jgi:hypothetical protein
MLLRVIKGAFCLTVRGASLPQKVVQNVEEMSGKAKRIELSLLVEYHLPRLAQQIDSMEAFRNIVDYN